MSNPRLPTEPGFYWVRARREDQGADSLGEQVVWYEADPDDERPVRAHGNDSSFRVDDFEWLEGPIRRKS